MNTTVKLVVAGLTALAVGVGIGAAGSNSTTTPGPAPAACMQALDGAESVMDLSAQAMYAMSEGIDAGSRFDAAGIQATTEKLKALTPKMGDARQAYDAAAGQCRGAA